MMQSLAQEIHAFSKCNLRKQSTHVTTLGGKRVIEKCQGATVEESVDPGNVCGYVQDNSLDLQIGIVGPYLLIASQDVAQDFDALRKFKVSHILNVAYGVGNAFPDLFIYKKLNILDLPETDITSYFQECSQFIDDVKAEKGTVLVHCNAGVSRSAAIVIGYLMSRKGLQFEEAYALVKTARPAVCPNRGFLEQLKSYKPQGDVRVDDITPD